ncbi:MAG: tetratricopeptide repeat protein [Polyangia bacterium]
MLRCAATLAVVLLVAAPALARTTRAADARERAAVHWKSGSARYAAGEWMAALDEFQAGYAAHPSPPFLVNIGQCLRKLDRLDEAALAFRRFLDTHTGSARTRLDVYDAFEDVTSELNRRVDSLAESAALFGDYLQTADADPALRAKVQAARDEILRTLVTIDDKLTSGYGVARALALPRSSSPEAAVERVRQRLTAMAAASSPNATSANQRSARSITHSHIRR